MIVWMWFPRFLFRNKPPLVAFGLFLLLLAFWAGVETWRQDQIKRVPLSKVDTGTYCDTEGGPAYATVPKYFDYGAYTLHCKSGFVFNYVPANPNNFINH